LTERGSRLLGAGFAAFGAIAFSGKAVIVKLAYVHGVDAVTLLTLRMAFAAPLFGLLAIWSSTRESHAPLDPRDWVHVGVLGLVGYYLASYFDFLGLRYISAGLERLVLFLNPTFVVLLSALFLGRAITRRDVVAIALAYAGIAVAFAHDAGTNPGNVALGSSWVLLSALFYAAYLMGSGRMVQRVGSLRFASFAGLVSCGGVIVHYLVVQPVAVIFSQPAPVYGLALLMAALCTVIPIAAMAEGIRRIGASHASIIGSVGPIATIFLAWVFLGEPITPVQSLGAALVMAGVLYISLGKGGSK
jgi:drug/metabolite transporter (DMT)-like permease